MHDEVLDLPTEKDGVKHVICKLPPSVEYGMALESPTEARGEFNGGGS